MKNIILLLFIVTISLLLGCSKKLHNANTSGTNRASDSNSLTDWGTIEFLVGTPKHLALNDGKNCTLTATLLPDGNLLVVIESDEKITAEDQIPSGEPQFPVGTPVHSWETMTIPSGETISGHVGNRMVRFAAKLMTP